MSALFKLGLNLAETGWLPDVVVRMGIRQLVRTRVQQLQRKNCEELQDSFEQFMEHSRNSPIALAPVESNRQHYEVPTEFFRYVLGRNMKYSSCYWASPAASLDAAEENALRTTCERAELADGMNILELGCGWGSLSLWMAKQYPKARITTVSNAASQKKHINATAQSEGLNNLEVICSDINQLTIDTKFDRIVSVEMFEHIRNHAELFRRISNWLNDDGKLFVHIFCHQSEASPYESKGPQDWMTDYFFTGGMMPSDRLFAYYQQHLRLIKQWRWSGKHYERTSNAWLNLQDANRMAILPILESTYGKEHATCWNQRWRMFFMACAEMFGYRQGNEWWISHYLFDQ